MAAIREAIYQVLSEYRPMTVRQVFYQLVSRGVIEKAEREYKGTVCRLLTQMRLDGELPYNWIADNSRWMRKPSSQDSMVAALETTVRAYRKDLWQDQDSYVEIWLEKEALAGVLYEETADWNVALMVTRGYPSLTFLYEAAMSVPDNKDVYLYYFGDHDPSGIDIPRHVEERLDDLGAYFHFERVAVTPDQISEWKLPTRPTKRSDTRARYFRGESVELDAINPRRLRQLVSDCISRHVDKDAWDRMRNIEALERESADAFMSHLKDLETDVAMATLDEVSP
jgi:hypothetical protein